MGTGDAMGRMTSVSGSLGFGSMIVMAFILTILKYRKYLPLIIFCWIFSGQRSAWIGGIMGILVYLYELLRNGKITKGFSILIGTIILGGVIYYTITSVLEIDLSFIEYRISRIGNAALERNNQWIDGWHNFTENIFGHGGGQAGQIAARHKGGIQEVRLVPDGDYFRILSEYGIIGTSYFITTIIMTILLLFTKLNNKQTIIIALMTAILIQMIGSNVTEFYFTNYMIWCFIGYFYLLIKQKIKL